MKISLFSAVLVGMGALIFPTKAAPLTPEQIEVLKSKAEALKQNLETHLATRNTNAGDVFLAASTDPKKAFDLWMNCEQKINYEREGKRESEFREWRDARSDLARDDRFMESLMMQLKYLGLSCKAAQAESIKDVFPALLSYAEGLSRMKELPTNFMTSSIANSIFAEAYNLRTLLGKNGSWEPVPYSISGIYEKSILPYLRQDNTGGLMNAWDKRIEQQTRLAEALNAAIDEEEREIYLLDGRQKDVAQKRLDELFGSKTIQSHDRDDFARETLPRLKWSKLKDQFRYIDQVMGAKTMLDFVEEHLTHELGEEFYTDFMATIEDSRSEAATTSAPTTESN